MAATDWLPQHGTPRVSHYTAARKGIQSSPKNALIKKNTTGKFANVFFFFAVFGGPWRASDGGVAPWRPSSRGVVSLSLSLSWEVFCCVCCLCFCVPSSVALCLCRLASFARGACAFLRGWLVSAVSCCVWVLFWWPCVAGAWFGGCFAFCVGLCVSGGGGGSSLGGPSVASCLRVARSRLGVVFVSCVRVAVSVGSVCGVAGWASFFALASLSAGAGCSFCGLVCSLRVAVVFFGRVALVRLVLFFRRLKKNRRADESRGRKKILSDSRPDRR